MEDLLTAIYLFARVNLRTDLVYHYVKWQCLLNIIPWCYLTFPQYRTLSQERSSRSSLANHKSSTSKYPRNNILLQCGKTFCHRVYDICKYARNIASMKTIYSTPTVQLLDESAITSLIIRIIEIDRCFARINRPQWFVNVYASSNCYRRDCRNLLRRPWDLFHLTRNYFRYFVHALSVYFRMFVGWVKIRNVIIWLHFFQKPGRINFHWTNNNSVSVGDIYRSIHFPLIFFHSDQIF